MANEDKAYCDWLRKRACAMCESPIGVAVHHHTNGTLSPVFPEPGRTLGSSEHPRGKNQRAHDHWGIPLCIKCHIPGIHSFGGHFRGMDNKSRRDWQDGQVRLLRALYLDEEIF